MGKLLFRESGDHIPGLKRTKVGIGICCLIAGALIHIAGWATIISTFQRNGLALDTVCPAAVIAGGLIVFLPYSAIFTMLFLRYKDVNPMAIYQNGIHLPLNEWMANDMMEAYQITKRGGIKLFHKDKRTIMLCDPRHHTPDEIDKIKSILKKKKIPEKNL